MKKIFLLLFAGSALLFAAGQYANRRAPGFSLSDITGAQHDPQDHRGQVVIIDVMTTTCGECQKLTAKLKEVEAKEGKKVSVLSIVTMPDTADKVRRIHSDVWSGLADPVRLRPGDRIVSEGDARQPLDPFPAYVHRGPRGHDSQ